MIFHELHIPDDIVAAARYHFEARVTEIAAADTPPEITWIDQLCGLLLSAATREKRRRKK